jgi:hypothetical protein
MEPPISTCVVQDWINGLQPEYKEALDKVRQNQQLNAKQLFDDLHEAMDLPYKLTAFRSHMRGYCSCQK